MIKTKLIVQEQFADKVNLEELLFSILPSTKIDENFNSIESIFMQQGGLYERS